MFTEKSQTTKVDILARAVGRRKKAVAQVQIVKGTGKFLINDKAANVYLQNHVCSILAIKAPFEEVQNFFSNNSTLELGSSDNLIFSGKNMTGISPNIDTLVKVQGGGLLGQAEAIQLGISKALCEIEKGSLSIDAELHIQNETPIRKSLKLKGYLTTDSRSKERRKYGLKKARKASQYHKR
jgi:small subunit ribosomal protein S9